MNYMTLFSRRRNQETMEFISIKYLFIYFLGIWSTLSKCIYKNGYELDYITHLRHKCLRHTFKT